MQTNNKKTDTTFSKNVLYYVQIAKYEYNPGVQNDPVLDKIYIVMKTMRSHRDTITLKISNGKIEYCIKNKWLTLTEVILHLVTMVTDTAWSVHALHTS